MSMTFLQLFRVKYSGLPVTTLVKDPSALKNQPLAHAEVDASLKWWSQGGVWLLFSEGH